MVFIKIEAHQNMSLSLVSIILDAQEIIEHLNTKLIKIAFN